jgi:phage N-6-adenine-methyltransferase
MIRTEGRQNWRTPKSVFFALDSEFRFQLDVAADDENHLCPLYYTEADNALAREWIGPAFLNPPFSDGEYKGERGLSAWLLKAREQADLGGTVVVLAPGDWSPGWFWKHVYGHAREIRLAYPRINYDSPCGTKKSGANGPSFVLVYRPGVTRQSLIVPWTWKSEPEQDERQIGLFSGGKK